MGRFSVDLVSAGFLVMRLKIYGDRPFGENFPTRWLAERAYILQEAMGCYSDKFAKQRY